MTPPPSSPPKGWGPSHQTPRPTRNRPLTWALGLLMVWWYSNGGSTTLMLALLGLGFGLAAFIKAYREQRAEERTPASRIVNSSDPLTALLTESARHGGVYLGTARDGEWRTSGAERAALVLGPPRSGKSSGVIIPAVTAHPGAVVSTSTKPDVLAATIHARSRLGTIWRFDPTGSLGTDGGVQLRWSPVAASGSWDGALMMARAMITGAGVGVGTTDQTHWSRRAQALLAPLLHAAAAGGYGVDRVLDWVLGHELDEPGVLLKRADAELACGVLVGLQNTEARERSSIFSAAADALDAYSSHGALAAAFEPNFDAGRFVRSSDTIYIHAPAEHQALAAPLVCGLLAEIRAATYQAHRERALSQRVLFGLDEAANIAPLGELPAIASEGGGQGLSLLAAFQDLSQARARWGPAADGFLTLFGAKLILPGIADAATLQTVSLALGEYDRKVVSTTNGPPPAGVLLGSSTSRTVSTQRQRVLSPGDVANIPAGHALHLDGVRWELLRLTQAHRDQPWRTLTQPTDHRPR